jgi:hypothetical protein
MGSLFQTRFGPSLGHASSSFGELGATPSRFGPRHCGQSPPPTFAGAVFAGAGPGGVSSFGFRAPPPDGATAACRVPSAPHHASTNISACVTAVNLNAAFMLCLPFVVEWYTEFARFEFESCRRSATVSFLFHWFART